jgi:hypothetical protein
MQSIKLKLDLDKANTERAINFLEKYALETMIGDPEKKVYYGVEQTPRTCRFCKRSTPAVRFKMDAHIMPEFMGNKYLLSKSECDDCNTLFGHYETSFADFFGLSRTFAQIRGKANKVPKFKDPKTGLEVKLTDTGIKMTTIEGADPITHDFKNKKIEIVTERPGYIPIHIPKCILKIGLSMLDWKDLDDYDYTRQFITTSEKDIHFKNSHSLRIHGYFIPGPTIFMHPFAQLLLKKMSSQDEGIPTRQVVIYYANYCFQMILPFSKPDLHLQGKKIDVPIFPLLIDNAHFKKYGEYQQLNLNLTSNEKKSGQEHRLSFSFDTYTDTFYKDNQTVESSSEAIK